MANQIKPYWKTLWKHKTMEKNKFQDRELSEDIIQAVKIKVRHEQYF